jgi:hypothetical protein
VNIHRVILSHPVNIHFNNTQRFWGYLNEFLTNYNNRTMSNIEDNNSERTKESLASHSVATVQLKRYTNSKKGGN